MSAPTSTTSPKKKNPKMLYWALGCIIAIVLIGRFMTSDYSLSQIFDGGNSRQYTPPRPIELWMSHAWSSTTYRNINEAWSFATDPVSAILEARDLKNPQVVLRLEGNVTLPANWSAIQWRLASDDQSSRPVKLTITRYTR